METIHNDSTEDDRDRLLSIQRIKITMLQQTIDRQQKEIGTLQETIERLTEVASVGKYRQEYASPDFFMRKGPPVVDFVPPRGTFRGPNGE